MRGPSLLLNGAKIAALLRECRANDWPRQSRIAGAASYPPRWLFVLLQREREELQAEVREAQIQIRELKSELRMLEEQGQRDAEMASDTILDLERDIDELKRSTSDTQRLLGEQIDVCAKRIVVF